MNNTALVQILQNLPPIRQKAFEKYLQSPFHVTHEGVGKLYTELKKHLHEPEIQAETLRKALKTEQKQFYHWTNYLLNALEDFIALEEWQLQNHERELYTIGALRRLRLQQPAAAMLRYARKRLGQSPVRGLQYYTAEYRLQTEDFLGSTQQGRTKAFKLQALTDAQDLAFMVDKLRIGCLLLSHQAVAQQDYDAGLLPFVLRFLENSKFLEVPLLAAYYYAYQAASGGKTEDFLALKTALQNHAGQFAANETHDLYLLAINFCIRRINRGDAVFFREIFELYQSGLEYGALMDEGVLSRWTYNNITATALRLRELTWLEHFLRRYADYLPEEHREGAFQYNMARYHYESGNRRAAMQHLLHREHDDVLQNLSAKVILCKIYFEEQELDALENQLDSIQIYLRRKKVIGYHRDNYNATVRCMRKLLSINPLDNAAKNKLRAEIEAMPLLPEREWMLGKL